jgi:hypothetical protein
MFRVFLEGAQRHTRSRARHVYRGHIRMHISDSILPRAAACIQTVLLTDGSLKGQSGTLSEHLTSASFSPLKGKPWAGDSGAGTAREAADPVL